MATVGYMTSRQRDRELDAKAVREILRDPRNWVAAKYLRSCADQIDGGGYVRHSYDDLIDELEGIAPTRDARCVDLLGMYSLVHEGVVYGMAIGRGTLAFRLPEPPAHLERPGNVVLRQPKFAEHPDTSPKIEEPGGDWVLVSAWRVIGDRSRKKALEQACLDSYEYMAKLDPYTD